VKAFLQVASKAVLLQHHFSFAPSPANTILIAPQLLMALQVFLPPRPKPFLAHTGILFQAQPPPSSGTSPSGASASDTSPATKSAVRQKKQVEAGAEASPYCSLAKHLQLSASRQ